MLISSGILWLCIIFMMKEESRGRGMNQVRENGDVRKRRRAAGRRRRKIILIIEIIVLLFLAIALFIVSKLGKIEKTELDMDKIEVNENISEESMEIMKGYQTIALF